MCACKRRFSLTLSHTLNTFLLLSLFYAHFLHMMRKNFVSSQNFLISYFFCSGFSRCLHFCFSFFLWRINKVCRLHNKFINILHFLPCCLLWLPPLLYFHIFSIRGKLAIDFTKIFNESNTRWNIYDSQYMCQINCTFSKMIMEAQ